jgi:hypothetical protein
MRTTDCHNRSLNLIGRADDADRADCLAIPCRHGELLKRCDDSPSMGALIERAAGHADGSRVVVAHATDPTF